MALLARPASRTSRPRPAASMATVAIVDACVELHIGGAIVSALPEGALWIEASRALVFSDLHLEKGSAFAKGGQMLPPYDTHATLARLARLVEERRPDIVVSLGDSFHDGGGVARMGDAERAQLHGLIARSDWVWVEGNHEGRAPEALGGTARDVLHLGSIALRHEPTGEPGEIAGHLHPCAKVSGRGRSVRRRCFATDGERLVMPAFGAYTGGLNVCDAAFAPIFPNGVTALVLGKDRVLPTPFARLLPDVN